MTSDWRARPLCSVAGLPRLTRAGVDLSVSNATPAAMVRSRMCGTFGIAVFNDYRFQGTNCGGFSFSVGIPG